MKRTAAAAILFQTNTPLQIEEIELPQLQSGQVLVEIHYSGLCRSQLMEVRGGRGVDRWLPHLLGHEGSGTVLEIGEGITRFKPGDKVIMGWLRSNGREAPGARYSCSGKTINSGCICTLASHSIVSENRLNLIPEDVPLDIAPLFGCALMTGAGMVFNELKPEVGSTVIVLGLGGIGFSALLALSLYQCHSLIAIDPSPEKRALAKEFGATHVFDSADPRLEHDIQDLTSGGADACIEAAGSVRSIELGFRLIRKGGGTLLFASHPPDGELIRLAPHDLISGKKISGSWGGASQPATDIPKLAALYRQGKFPLHKLMTKYNGLEKVNQALDDLEVGKVFRPLLKITASS